MLAAEHVLHYLRGTYELGIRYHRDAFHPDQLWGWVDADWAGDIETRRSHTGYVLMLNGGPVSWKSRRQDSVALSTSEAEYMAASLCGQEVVYIRSILRDFGVTQTQPKLVYEDKFDGGTINADFWEVRQNTTWAIRDGVLHGDQSTKEFQAKKVAEGDKAHAGFKPVIWLKKVPENFVCAMRVRYDAKAFQKGFPLLDLGHHLCDTSHGQIAPLPVPRVSHLLDKVVPSLSVVQERT
jgi:hypothetical protein